MSEARIDKWLWSARIFKTRTIAADACKNGRVQVNGVQVKPSRMVKVGDVIAVRKPPVTYSFKILKAISEHKLGFEDADGVYEDYKHTYAKYTYHQLDDWIWLLKVLKTNENNTDEVLTQILYKGSRYASKSFPDEFFTNDR